MLLPILVQGNTLKEYSWPHFITTEKYDTFHMLHQPVNQLWDHREESDSKQDKAPWESCHQGNSFTSGTDQAKPKVQVLSFEKFCHQRSRYGSGNMIRKWFTQLQSGPVLPWHTERELFCETQLNPTGARGNPCVSVGSTSVPGWATLKAEKAASQWKSFISVLCYCQHDDTGSRMQKVHTKEALQKIKARMIIPLHPKRCSKSALYIWPLSKRCL